LNPKTSFEALETGFEALESGFEVGHDGFKRFKTVSGDFMAILDETHGVMGLELAVGFA
jgi:hypothetical protein